MALPPSGPRQIGQHAPPEHPSDELVNAVHSILTSTVTGYVGASENGTPGRTSEMFKLTEALQNFVEVVKRNDRIERDRERAEQQAKAPATSTVATQRMIDRAVEAQVSNVKRDLGIENQRLRERIEKLEGIQNGKKVNTVKRADFDKLNGRVNKLEEQLSMCTEQNCDLKVQLKNQKEQSSHLKQEILRLKGDAERTAYSIRKQDYTMENKIDALKEDNEAIRIDVDNLDICKAGKTELSTMTARNVNIVVEKKIAAERSRIDELEQKVGTLNTEGWTQYKNRVNWTMGAVSMLWVAMPQLGLFVWANTDVKHSCELMHCRTLAGMTAWPGMPNLPGVLTQP